MCMHVCVPMQGSECACLCMQVCMSDLGSNVKCCRMQSIKNLLLSKSVWITAMALLNQVRNRPFQDDPSLWRMSNKQWRVS